MDIIIYLAVNAIAWLLFGIGIKTIWALSVVGGLMGAIFGMFAVGGAIPLEFTLDPFVGAFIVFIYLIATFTLIASK